MSDETRKKKTSGEAERVNRDTLDAQDDPWGGIISINGKRVSGKPEDTSFKDNSFRLGEVRNTKPLGKTGFQL